MEVVTGVDGTAPAHRIGCGVVEAGDAGRRAVRGRVGPVARVRLGALLVDGHLEQPAQRAVVAVHRTGREAGLELVVEPVLDLVRGDVAQPVRTEVWQDVLVEVAAVGLLGSGRQAPREAQELLGPRRDRQVGAARVDPTPPGLVGLDLYEEPLGIRLAPERERAMGDPADRGSGPGTRPMGSCASR